LHRIVAWPSGNAPTKNHKDRPRGSPPPRGLNRKGVGQTGESRPFGGDNLITEPYRTTIRLQLITIRKSCAENSPVPLSMTLRRLNRKGQGGGQTGESGISPPISRYLFIIQLFIYSWSINK